MAAFVVDTTDLRSRVLIERHGRLVPVELTKTAVLFGPSEHDRGR